MPIIEINNLTKDYEVGFWRKRKVRALDGLSMTVEPHQIFGFLGANGAGKTTTLKLLMRLIFPTAGSARILDRDIGDVSMHARIGYLPEAPPLYPEMTVEDYLMFVARLKNVASGEVKSRTEHVMQRCAVADVKSKLDALGGARNPKVDKLEQWLAKVKKREQGSVV